MCVWLLFRMRSGWDGNAAFSEGERRQRATAAVGGEAILTTAGAQSWELVEGITSDPKRETQGKQSR